ncbi:hypothetical protein DFH06DRAFT_1308571 [Mycena polygramma]|nr:hypothetical protein DFH06DRAFT_1308571 [Mycena polygramma]
MDTTVLPACLPVQEMWDHIIDELRRLKDWQSCSLVCRSFLARAQSHIFRRISIHKKLFEEPDIVAKQLVSILTKSPHIIPYIRILYLGECRPAVVAHLLQISWTHLEDLTVSCLGDPITVADLEQIYPLVGLPTLRRIAFSGKGWGAEEMFKALSHCTPRLERIEFWNCDPQIGSFQSTELAITDLSSLTYLRSSGSSSGNFKSFILRHCSTVESLHLGGEDSGIERINLGIFPALQYLGCDDMGYEFNEMLKSLPPNNVIDTIRVNLFGPTLTMDLIADFQATIIAVKMPMLRRVELEVNTTHSPFFIGADPTALASMIRRDLGQIQERGQLFVFRLLGDQGTYDGPTFVRKWSCIDYETEQCECTRGEGRQMVATGKHQMRHLQCIEEIHCSLPIFQPWWEIPARNAQKSGSWRNDAQHGSLSKTSRSSGRTPRSDAACCMSASVRPAPAEESDLRLLLPYDAIDRRFRDPENLVYMPWQCNRNLAGRVSLLPSSHCTEISQATVAGAGSALQAKPNTMLNEPAAATVGHMSSILTPQFQSPDRHFKQSKIRMLRTPQLPPACLSSQYIPRGRCMSHHPLYGSVSRLAHVERPAQFSQGTHDQVRYVGMKSKEFFLKRNFYEDQNCPQNPCREEASQLKARTCCGAPEGHRAPLEDIRPHILRYWKMHHDDKTIVRLLNDHHIDGSKYELGFVTLQALVIKPREVLAYIGVEGLPIRTRDMTRQNPRQRDRLKRGQLSHTQVQSRPKAPSKESIEKVRDLTLGVKESAVPGISCWVAFDNLNKMRRHFTPGFENILDVGVKEGWLVFRWVFIPWLQTELDRYVDRINNTAKRADRNKILPHGVPNDICEHPADYGVLDFKIKVNPNAINDVRGVFAPPENEVFQLVPPDFQDIIAQIYMEIGQPPLRELLVGMYTTNFWAYWGYALAMAGDAHAKDIELTPNFQPLRNGEDVIGPGGAYYMGGVNNGNGLGTGAFYLLPWGSDKILDAAQSTELDDMLNEDEPVIREDDSNDEGEIFALFSDEEVPDDATNDEW